MMHSVDPAPSTRAEHVLSDADLVGLITSMLHDDTDDRGPTTRAARSLCLTSKAVLAAVLASVRRVRMDGTLAVLQQMASLVSLRVGPGPLDPSQLRQLTHLQADGVSSLQILLAILQLTRLRELRLEIAADKSGRLRRALGASRASAASAAWT
jgi:hypothetical protein